MNERISQKEWKDWINANILSVDDYSSTSKSGGDGNGNGNDLWLDHFKEACKCSKIQIQTLSSSSLSTTTTTTTTTKPLLAVGLFYQLLSHSPASPCIRAVTCLSENELQLLQQWKYCVKPFYWLQFMHSIEEV